LTVFLAGIVLALPIPEWQASHTVGRSKRRSIAMRMGMPSIGSVNRVRGAAITNAAVTDGTTTAKERS
jgi:hypothetical protein